MWGSSTFHKLGLTHNQNTVDEPRQMEWLTEQVGFVTETGKTAVRS